MYNCIIFKLECDIAKSKNILQNNTSIKVIDGNNKHIVTTFNKAKVEPKDKTTQALDEAIQICGKHKHRLHSIQEFD